MNHAEQVLLNHLTDPDSLDYLAQEGFSGEAARDIIKSEPVRYLLEWALIYFFENSRKVTPSLQAFPET